MPQPCPEPGNETTRGKYTYDAWNRLVKVVEDTDGDGNAEAGGDDTVLAEYRYDGLNRRIRKYTDEPESGSDWTVREYYYNADWQCLEVRKGVESRASEDPEVPWAEPAVATAACEQYVWSPRYVDAPVIRDRDTDASTATGDLGKTDSGLDERLFYVTDANFNVTALVQGTPDDSGLGHVVERYLYDPYGKVTVLHGEKDTTDPENPIYYDKDGDVTEWDEDTGGSDWDNEILFCGYRFDAETSLYHVRHRMYHPTLGRWLQRDPLGYVDGMSLYEYVGSNPCAYADPQGHEKHEKKCPTHWRQTPWGKVWNYFESIGRAITNFSQSDTAGKIAAEGAELTAKEKIKEMRDDAIKQGQDPREDPKFAEMKARTHGAGGTSKEERKTLDDADRDALTGKKLDDASIAEKRAMEQERRDKRAERRERQREIREFNRRNREAGKIRQTPGR